MTKISKTLNRGRVGWSPINKGERVSVFDRETREKVDEGKFVEIYPWEYTDDKGRPHAIVNNFAITRDDGSGVAYNFDDYILQFNAGTKFARKERREKKRENLRKMWAEETRVKNVEESYKRRFGR